MLKRQLYPLDCGISGGFDINCQDLRKPGGLFRAVWVFNKGDLRTPIDVTLGAVYVTNLDFSTYQSLYKFESNKYSHEADWQQQEGEGGNISFLQTVILRVANNTPGHDKVVEDATVSELVVITRSQASEYLLWGAENGLSSTPNTTGGTGRQATDSAFVQLNLAGTERFLPRRLLIGGTAANTQLYLDSATA